MGGWALASPPPLLSGCEHDRCGRRPPIGGFSAKNPKPEREVIYRGRQNEQQTACDANRRPHAIPRGPGRRRFCGTSICSQARRAGYKPTRERPDASSASQRPPSSGRTRYRGAHRIVWGRGGGSSGLHNQRPRGGFPVSPRTRPTVFCSHCAFRPGVMMWCFILVCYTRVRGLAWSEERPLRGACLGKHLPAWRLESLCPSEAMRL